MLPVPSDRVVYDLGVDPEQVPVAPPNIRLPNHLYNYLPQFTRDISIGLKHNATRNPVRTFMFNLMSSSNWTNEAFRDIIHLAIMWYELLQNNPNEYSKIINDIQTLYAADLAIKYPELMNYIPQESKISINENVQQLNKLKKEIAMYGRGYPGPANRPPAPPGPPNYPQYPQNNYGAPQQPYPPQQPMAYPQAGYGPPQQPYPPQQPMAYGRPNYPQYGQPQSSGQPTDNRSAANIHSNSGRYGNYADKHEQKNPEPQELYVQPEEPVELVPYPGEEFPPLIIPGFSRRQEIIDSRFYKWSIEETDVDRDAHSLVFRDKNDEDRELKLDKAAQQLKEIDEDRKKSEGDKALSDKLYYNKTWIADPYLSGLESEATLRYYKHYDDDNPGICVLEGIVASPIIVDRALPEKPFVNIIGNMFKGRDLKTTAREITKGISSSISIKNKAAFKKVDKILTALVNNFLKYQVGLDGVCIESFAEDYMELDNYLDNTYGSRYGEALRRWDQDTLRVFVAENDEEMLEQMYGDMLDNEKIALSPLSTRFNVVVAGITDSILNLEDLDDGAPKKITNKVSPLLYKVAEATVGKKENDGVLTVLLTTDGRKFNIVRDYLNNSYIIFKK